MKSHSGINLVEAFVQIMEEFGISEKLLSITCDNASSNDSMINELSKLIDGFPGEVNRTRCFVHIVNLIAKSLLKQFNVPKKKADEMLSSAEKELWELAEDLDLEERQTRVDELLQVDAGTDVEVDDEEGFVDEREMMSTDEREDLEKSILPVKFVLTKLRKISYKIIHSTTILLPAWKATLTDLKLPIRMIPHNVATHWNSTYDMLMFALQYKKAVRTIVGDTHLGLEKYELTAHEWQIAEQLRDVLHILKDATLFFSRATPNLATVIPTMDHIDHRLATDSLDPKFNAAIRASLTMAKKTLNHYYDLTDSSEVYRIAMVLHPCHKLEYFKNANWETDWINTACDLVQDEYKRSYASLEVPADDKELAIQEVEVVSSSTQVPNIFDVLPALSAPQPNPERNELDRYLSTDTEHVENVFTWWLDWRDQFPRLSRMAIDYLTIPATSVAVERVFSRGHLLLSHIRNRLSAQTTRALLCLGDWSLLGLIKDTDVLKVANMADVPQEEEVADGEYEMVDGWDNINLA
ncbi:hypothetical protein EWM64_g10802 [Hericium alpestre]|uniref:HAT C-terminal dimerisation domain-containing protein n=1 Tax=Hericium alpestre TaxID=135208 RepID=A0A4Y9ZGB3_9AGAM|nr:hypothetical protein EWM64_g10802 [Hericium alpestre]